MNNVQELKRIIIAKLGGPQNINKIYSDYKIRKIIKSLRRGKITYEEANDLFLSHYNEVYNTNKMKLNFNDRKYNDLKSEILEFAKNIIHQSDGYFKK